MKNATRLFLLTGLIGLTGCSFLPSSSSNPPSSSSSAGASSSSVGPSSGPSDVSSNAPLSSQPSEAPSSDSSESTLPPIAEPTLSLPLGVYGRIEVTKHQYTTVDYHINVPYEGNDYEFPAPILSNYEGEYDFVYSDSESIIFIEKNDALFVRAKYHFGGYFHMKALSKEGEEIDDIYIQLETTQVGRGQLHVYNFDTKEEIAEDSTYEIAPGERLRLKPTYNAEAHYDILSISDNTLASLQTETYYVVVKAGREEGEATISAAYSVADSTGTSYDYSFSFTLRVHKARELSSIRLDGEEVYLVNEQPKYNGTFYAVYASGETEEIDESDLTMEVVEGNKVRFSYTLGEATKEVTYDAKAIEASSYDTTSLKHSFRDYWKHYSTGLTSLPLSGQQRFLVIPIWFQNSTDYFDVSKKAEIREDIEEICFGEKVLGAGTLKTFYEEESLGKVTISGKVAEWYDDENSSTLYNDRITDTVHALFDRAVADYIEKNPEDHIENYDRNDDNKFDGVIFFYAANYYGNLGYTDSNAFAFHFNDSGVGADEYMNNCAFCPVGEMYGFTGAPKGEQKGTSDLSALHSDAYENAASIVIHESGHMFGALDLYTEAGNAGSRKSEQAYQFAGKFSMQDNDCGAHDPLQTYLYNWGAPMVFSADKYEVGTKLSVYLNDFQQGHNSILLSPSWNEYDSPFDEYMLLELFSPSGLNKYHAEKGSSAYDAKGSGIRLWHADAGLMKDNNNQRGYFPVQQGTSFIASNHNVWEMNNFHFAHMVRNDEAVDYQPINGMKPSDLFQADDAFSMERFHKQFLNEEGVLDSGKKLGWEFKVTSLFHNGKGGYDASIELTRVDDTVTEFKAETQFSDISTFPQGESVDATKYFQLPEEHLKLTANQNASAVAPTVGYQSPDYYLCLGQGSYVELSMVMESLSGDPTPIGTIKKIQLLYTPSTTYTKRADPTVKVGDETIVGTKDSLGIPFGDPFYMCWAFTYEINSSSVRIFNEASDNLYLNAIRIEYSVFKK